MNRFRLFAGLLLSAVFLFCLLPSLGRASQDTVPEGWTGIYTRADLEKITLFPSGKYILMNDIDLTGTAWSSLCSEDEPFAGELDGNGYAVYGLSVSSPSSAAGLISYICGGRVSGLSVYGSSSGPIAGLLVGKISAGTVTDCSVSGTVSVSFCGGGIVGQISGGDVTLTNCSAQVALSGTGTADEEVLLGGVVGGVSGSGHLISTCETSGSLSFSGPLAVLGGIAGAAEGELTVSDCGTESGLALVASDTAYVGGMVGRGGSESLELLRCSFRADWTVTEGAGFLYAGGMAGLLSGEKTVLVDGCVSYGSISSVSPASLGGTVGASYARGGAVTVTRCSSFVSLSGTGCPLAMGGIVGTNRADAGTVGISDCYAGGFVSYRAYINEDTSLFFGGIAGFNGGDGIASLSRCFSACEVTVDYPLSDGAVVGVNAPFSDLAAATVTQCYYRAGVREYFATPVQGAALSDPASYPGFDFTSVWRMDSLSGMPLLQWADTSLTPPFPGDVDGNGRLTEYDARLLSQYLTGNAVLTDAQFARCDINGDGRTDARDVALILRNAG